MAEPNTQLPAWNLTEPEWQTLVTRASSATDLLEDGAYVRASPAQPELDFYATSLNKPAEWHYAFQEEIPNADRRGALVGRAWHEPETGFVQFEVMVYAGAQALRADYESDVGDMDYVAYETAVEQALRGTPADLAWLHREFARLVAVG